MKLLRHPRIIILIVLLLLSLLAISPQPSADGVSIRQVAKGSAAALAGIQSPEAGVAPTNREVITAVNGVAVHDVESYYDALDDLLPNQTVVIQTDQTVYRLQSLAQMQFDNETNSSVVVGVQDLGLSVYNAPSSNIRKGLDLSGGTRVVLSPVEPVAQEDLDLITQNLDERLNAFGLSDVQIRQASDLSGDDFIVIEIAGANKDEVRELVESQGVFEAKVDNETVFSGGDDITFVCRSPDCSGIDTRSGGCGQVEGGWSCRFSFAISLSPEAAERQAAATRDLTIVNDGNGAYLSSPLELYLDGELIDSLSIAGDLQGRAVTDIQISGSGLGASQQAALDDATDNMHQLQTILVTGSLPVELEIVKMDSISPVLGNEFLNNALLMGLVAILAVALVIFIAYRRLVISIPMIATMLSEAFIIFGFAAMAGWNIDLAAIAGVIIAIGTGVDDQIVIIDETLHGEKNASRSWKARLKNAFFIIFAAYVTTVFAMLPLFFAGAGLLRGFALTTIVGVTAGVFVTRPAFAVVVENLLKEND